MTVELSVKERRYLLWGAMAVFFLCHLYYLNAPPNGYHQWRESDTASIVANYCFEDMNPLHPRINQRGNLTGITGGEFPIYQYSSALLCKLLGFSHAIPRLLVVLAACLSIWLMFGIVSRLTRSTDQAIFAAIAFAFGPLLFFYSFKIMPDIWMLTGYLGAFYFYLKFIDDRRYLYWILSIVLLAFSASIKPLGLSLYLPLLYLWWTRQNRRASDFVLLTAYVVLTIAPAAGWYMHARHVNEEFGVAAFYLGRTLGDYSYLAKAIFYKKDFIQWPWELWIGWHFVPFFIYGLYLVIWKKTARIALVWIAAGYIVFAQLANYAATHDYYTLIIAPSFAMVTGLGMYRLYATNAVWKKVVIALLLFAPVACFIRVGSRLGETEEYTLIRDTVDRAIPKDALVMVQDNSRAIRLYQLDRKGWPLRQDTDLNRVRSFIADGADYIVLEEPAEEYLDSIALYIEPECNRIGPLYSYQIKK